MKNSDNNMNATAGVVTAVALIILLVVQIVLLCLKPFTHVQISWFLTMLPAVIVGVGILLAVLYFLIGSIIMVFRERRKEESPKEEE